MAKRYCKFPGCKSTDLHRKRFYRFPKDEERCRAWVKICNCRKIDAVPLPRLYTHYTMCEDHFQDWCFMNNKRIRLVHNALPCSPKPKPTPNPYAVSTNAVGKDEATSLASARDTSTNIRCFVNTKSLDDDDDDEVGGLVLAQLLTTKPTEIKTYSTSCDVIAKKKFISSCSTKNLGARNTNSPNPCHSRVDQKQRGPQEQSSSNISVKNEEVCDTNSKPDPGHSRADHKQGRRQELSSNNLCLKKKEVSDANSPPNPCQSLADHEQPSHQKRASVNIFPNKTIDASDTNNRPDPCLSSVDHKQESPGSKSPGDLFLQKRKPTTQDTDHQVREKTQDNGASCAVVPLPQNSTLTAETTRESDCPIKIEVNSTKDDEENISLTELCRKPSGGELRDTEWVKLRIVQEDENDPNMNFFRSLMPYMNMLSPMSALSVRNKMQNILFEELGRTGKECPSNSIHVKQT